jgi:hypothetical protein
MKSEKMQYLQFIQDVITRHNTNSFYIKGLSITIIAAIFGVSMAKEVYPAFPAFLTFILWMLDATYLKQERRFRELYKDAVSSRIEIYDMNINNPNYKQNYFKIMFSKTIAIFYLGLIVVNVLCFLGSFY